MRRFDSPTLARVVQGGLCSGCGLCAAASDGAVTMTVAAPGFNRPRQDRALSPVAERTIADACPGSRVEPWRAGGDVHPVWGPLERVATGAARDPGLRHGASSGGMLSALLVHALRTGMVDAVVQVAADPDAPTRNVTTVSTDPSEVVARAGSRYAPSSPLDGLDRLLDDPRRFAFVGKPCDASALRRFARHDPRVAERFPLVLSFFCGGIPSHAGARAILDELGMAEHELAAFRYRGNGWPGRATATARDGRSAAMSYARSWGGHLSRHVQFRCKICPDAVGGVADIACADAWYGDESGYPRFDEAEGRSLVIARTGAGRALLDAAIASGAVAVDPLDPAEIDRMQPAQARRKALLVARYAALALAFRPRPRVAGLRLPAAARRADPIDAFRNFLGTLRRLWRGQP